MTTFADGNTTTSQCDISHIPLKTFVKDYGGGEVEKTQYVPQQVDVFYANLLSRNDGICIADGEHRPQLYTQISSSLGELKAQGLKTIFVEVQRDLQNNIDKYLDNGDSSLLVDFPSTTKRSGMLDGGNFVSKEFLMECRRHGLRVRCMDVSEQQQLNELSNKFDNLGAGNEEQQHEALRMREKLVGANQANKDLKEVHNIRIRHNDQWMEVITRELSRPDAGKFLVIGGSAHFMNMINDNNSPDIDEKLALLGKKAPLVIASQSRVAAPVITTEPVFLSSQTFPGRDTPEYYISYPNQKDLPQIHNDVTEAYYKGYQGANESFDQCQFAISTHVYAVANIERIESQIRPLLPGGSLFDRLPPEHPSRSAVNVELLQEAAKELQNTRTNLTGANPDLQAGSVLLDSARARIRKYGGGIKAIAAFETSEGYREMWKRHGSKLEPKAWPNMATAIETSAEIDLKDLNERLFAPAKKILDEKAPGAGSQNPEGVRGNASMTKTMPTAESVRGLDDSLLSAIATDVQQVGMRLAAFGTLLANANESAAKLAPQGKLPTRQNGLV